MGGVGEQGFGAAKLASAGLRAPWWRPLRPGLGRWCCRRSSTESGTSWSPRSRRRTCASGWRPRRNTWPPEPRQSFSSSPRLANSSFFLIFQRVVRFRLSRRAASFVALGELERLDGRWVSKSLTRALKSIPACGQLSSRHGRGRAENQICSSGQGRRPPRAGPSRQAAARRCGISPAGRCSPPGSRRGEWSSPGSPVRARCPPGKRRRGCAWPPGRSRAGAFPVTADDADTVVDEQRDVAEPLAQRRDGHQDDAQPVVEVLAEAPSATISSRLRWSGGDDARPPGSA